MTGRHQIVYPLKTRRFTPGRPSYFASCVTRIDHHAIFIVHESGSAWQPDFSDLVRAGAIVRKAPTYFTRGVAATRNFAGSLIQAAPLCAPDELIVLAILT